MNSNVKGMLWMAGAFVLGGIALMLTKKKFFPTKTASASDEE